METAGAPESMSIIVQDGSVRKLMSVQTQDALVTRFPRAELLC